MYPYVLYQLFFGYDFLLIKSALFRKLPRMRNRPNIRVLLIIGLAITLGAFSTTEALRSNSNSFYWHLPFTRYQTVWQSMSHHYGLKYNSKNQMVNKELRFYLRRPHYILELTRNAVPYIYYIYQQTRKRNMPAELALLPMIESDYNPFAYSRTGATGLWQMMPGTASGFGLTINWWYDGRRSIIDSTQAALDYLTYLHEFFGNWLLAIAAYDSGEGTVQTAIAYNKRHHRPTDFWSLPLPKETKLYVPKLLALAAIMRNPNGYRMPVEQVPNQSYFTAINMTQQVDLSEVAKLSHTDIRTVLALNPGFRRWATTPHADYSLLLPNDKAINFKEKMASANLHPITWLHHKVESGESLGVIARKYKTNLAILKRVNHLSSNTIHSGQDLLVPLSYRGKKIRAFMKQHSSIREDKIPGPKLIEYTVKSRDNLWTVAARYGVTANQIRYWNSLSYNSSLKIGEKLTIWRHHRYHSKQTHYKVRRGDTISIIAYRFGINEKTLRDYNHLNNNIVRLGQRLIIPSRALTKGHYKRKLGNQMLVHHVRSGESLSVIAEYYRVTMSNIMNWNHLKNNIIHVGQPLKLYLHG